MKKFFALFLTLSVLFLSYGGCASLPEVEPVVKDASVKTAVPSVSDGRGPLSLEESKAILEKLKQKTGNTDILQRHIAIEEAIVGSPLITGNKVTLLTDGPATYEAMFKAIKNAKDTVNLEMYILEDDNIGNMLADLLIDRQKHGVQVNVIYDGLGSVSTSGSFFDRLKQYGVNVLEFNPLNPLAAKNGWDVNQRDHRKILVIDGAIAFTGGINISEVYSSSPSGRHFHVKKKLDSPDKKNKHEVWRDTQVEIEGPAAAELQKLFMETWQKQKGDPLPARNYFPKLQEKGAQLIRVIGGTPDAELNRIYVTFISAITNAENSIHITMAYFAPDPKTIDVLKQAAHRGVDVKLILPGLSDVSLVQYAGRSHYDDLLSAGVKIYERKQALLHAKTAVIDGVWSTVGSSNLDWRSFLHNDEANAVILGNDFAQQMEAMFSSDLKQSSEISLEQWRKRPLGWRFREWMARIWEYWL
jgi:cardiolipin synthase